MSISQLSYEINLLSAAKVKFSYIANQLVNAALALEPMGGRISSLYNVDENSTPVCFRIANTRIGLINLASTITGSILPAIDVQIYNKNNQLIYEQQMMMY